MNGHTGISQYSRSRRSSAMRTQAWVLLVLLGAGLVLHGCATDSQSPLVDPSGSEATSRSGIVKETLRIPTKELHAAGVEAETAEPEKGGAGPEPAAATWADVTSLPYHIEAGDMLEFRSLDDEMLTRQVTVRYDGCISLPLVPDVNVQDLTREAATAKVKEAFGEIFREPRISLAVVQATSKSIHVMGDVTRPSEFPYIRPISVIDAINNAGGPRINQRGGDSFVGSQGTLTKAFIIRRYGGAREVLECDLRKLTMPGAHPAETPVLPRDIIYVPEGVNLVYVLGEVRGPGVYQLVEGTTMLQLLARSGGIAHATARTSQVILIREVDENNTDVMMVDVKKALKTGQDILMQAGDIVYIPRKPLVRLQQFVSRFTGSITPLMSLYRQAWDTWYTKKSYDNLYDGSGNTSEVLQILQGFRDVGSLATSLPGLVP